MKSGTFKVLAAAALLAASASASAALIDAPVPGNAYITFGGLDWAWASPCSPTGCNAGDQPLDLSYQATQGWRLPTAEEFAARPMPEAFFFPGANVTYPGGSPEGTIFTGNPPLRQDGACAVVYFTSASPFNWCDFDDAAAGAIFGDPQWVGEANVETWLVRDVVPEPGSLALLGLGLTGLGLSRRRKA